MQHLHGDVTGVLPLLGEVHGCHAPVTKRPLDHVAVGQYLARLEGG